MTPAHIPRLTTKLTPPAAAPHQLTRHPAGLDAPTAARVVLVRAPAGFGKSTAMMQCHRALEARGQTVAWLTLDALDNDLSRFLHYLGEMMVQAGIASAPPRSPVEAVDAIAAHPSAFTFFMDELDTLRDAGVLGLLRELIERLPRGGQLVVGCRGWPDLGLGRLRARGQLVEVGPAQLRFSLEETRAFLRNRDAQLPEHALVTLHNRCEGWATGLWLASLALQRRRDTVALAESFSGSDQALAEYLAEDVLAHEPPEVREFLLRTSVLKQLTAPVCAALCPQTDCAAMLEHLATHGVFLTRIGDAPPTWRYHSLFASFLHARLAQQPGAQVRELHAAASHAYEAEGRPVPAIDHAILAQDHARAIALLAAHAEAFVEQGRLRLLDRWFQAVSPAALQGHERLTHLALWAACFTRGPIETLAQMGCGDARPAEGEAAHYLALRAMLLALQDRYADAYAVGQQALAALPSELPFADSALLNLMANISSVLGHTDESRRLLGVARSRFGGSTFNRMYAESLEGMFDLFEGRMRQATARFRIAVESTHQATFNQSHGNAWAGVLYAYAMYEANRLEKADHLLNIYLPMARDVGLPDHMILGHALRTRLAFAAGDVDSALHTLTELEHLGHLRHLPRVVAAAHLERARIFMQQGNSRAAQDELRRASAIPLRQRRAGRLPAAGAGSGISRARAAALGRLLRRRAGRRRRCRRPGHRRRARGPLPPCAQAAADPCAGRTPRGAARHGAAGAAAADRVPRRLRAPGAGRGTMDHAAAGRLPRGHAGRGGRPDLCRVPAPAAGIRAHRAGRRPCAGHARAARRAAHAQGTARAAAAGRGVLQQRHCREDGGGGHDGAHPPEAHQRQAGRRQPHAGGGAGQAAAADSVTIKK